MNYTELFNDKSDIYASARPNYPPELFEFLVSQCVKTGSARDCACGNGQAALDLVDYFDEVQATDVSANQIKNAFDHPKISYSVCPSENTSFSDASLDLICVAQALHWLKHDQLFTEVKRVLKPRGIFSAWGYCWTTINNEVDEVVQTSFLDVIEPYWAEQNKLLRNHYRDINVPFTLIETPTFRMETRWDLNQFFAYLHTWSATRRCMDAIGKDFFNEAYRQVLAVWGKPEKSKKVEMDFCCIVGRNEA